MSLFKIIFCDRAQILILILVMMTTMVIVSDALCNTMPVRDSVDVRLTDRRLTQTDRHWTEVIADQFRTIEGNLG